MGCQEQATQSHLHRPGLRILIEPTRRRLSLSATSCCLRGRAMTSQPHAIAWRHGAPCPAHASAGVSFCRSCENEAWSKDFRCDNDVEARPTLENSGNRWKEKAVGAAGYFHREPKRSFLPQTRLMGLPYMPIN